MRDEFPSLAGQILMRVIDSPQDLTSNDLLAALPPDVLLRWAPQLEWVDMPLGQVLYLPGDVPGHAFLPTTAIVSLLFVSANGSTSEVAIVGREGLVGVSIFMGGGSTPNRAVVQCAGQGLRLSAERMKQEFDHDGAVMHLMLRYTQALITQMAQTAVCNRHHRLDQQLCRWLLLNLDRLDGSDLVMTQDLISANLGVRREGVTEAAIRLQESGVIRYARGHIKVLDRPALEALTCECYAVVKREYDRLLSRRDAR